jgi:hypothetical protein
VLLVVVWDAGTKTFVRNVDYGKIVPEEQDTTADNATVIMEICISLNNIGSTQLNAYFLVNRLT